MLWLTQALSNRVVSWDGHCMLLKSSNHVPEKNRPWSDLKQQWSKSVRCGHSVTHICDNIWTKSFLSIFSCDLYFRSYKTDAIVDDRWNSESEIEVSFLLLNFWLRNRLRLREFMIECKMFSISLLSVCNCTIVENWAARRSLENCKNASKFVKKISIYRTIEQKRIFLLLCH